MRTKWGPILEFWGPQVIIFTKCQKAIKKHILRQKCSQVVYHRRTVFFFPIFQDMHALTRVFLKGHFVKNQKAHPTTQQGDTQGEHIQKERINKQV